ncbi:MAG TPA: TraK family protein, partial [Chryseosolibacter sp.]
RLGAGRVAFLARKEVIKEKVEAGHTLITVYEEYKNELGIGYVQFLNYVKKHIRKKGQEAEAPKKDEKKECVTAKIKNDPNFVANALKSDPNRKKEDLT